MTQAITTPSTMTIGIDLGDRKSHICALDAAGEVIEESQISTKPNPITNKPSLWLTNSACVPSRPTATVALAPCMARQDSQSKPVPNYPRRSTCTAIWR